MRKALLLSFALAGCFGGDGDSDPALSGSYQSKGLTEMGSEMLTQFDFGPDDSLRIRLWGNYAGDGFCLKEDGTANVSVQSGNFSLSNLKSRERWNCSDTLSAWEEYPDVTHQIRNIQANSFDFMFKGDSVWMKFLRP